MAEKVEYELSLKDLLSPKINEAESSVQKFEGSLGNLQGALGKVAVAVGAAFALNKVSDFAMSVVDVGSKVENATTGLTTMLKDSAAAAQVVNNTMEDATKTPFSFESLLSANKALISANVSAKDARTQVIDLANAIAATGGGDVELQRMVVNLQQIKNVGKATAMDIKQFAIAGVNIYQVLADATHKPISAVKDMEVTYDQLTMALAKAHAAGGIYAGGLENMAGNTSVQISNLGDAAFQLKNKMFTDLKPVITSVVSALAGFIGHLREGWDWLVKNKEMVGLVATVIGGAAIGYGLYSLAISAGTIATTLMTAAQWALNVAMSANPIGIVIVAIGALAAGIMYAWNKFVGFRAVVMGVWGTLKEFGSIVIDVFQGVWKMIHGVFSFNPKEINEGAVQAGKTMYEAGTRMATAYKKGYDEVMAEDAKNKAAENKPVTAAGKPAAKKATTETPATKDTSPKGATGQKVVTINVTIGKLIETFKVQTTNMQEGSGKVRELVAQTLLSAVNDSQITAGI